MADTILIESNPRAGTFPKPIPGQYWNATTGEYEKAQGAGGAPRVMLWGADGSALFSAENPGVVSAENLDIAVSALRDALTGPGAAAKTLADLATLLTAVKLTDGVKKITDALPAGTNLLGKVGIDQTTPGVTNKVVAELSGSIPASQSSYIIPMLDLLAWSGFTNQPANDAVEIVSDSAGDVGLCTIFGTTTETGAFAYETVTLTGTTAKASTKADWGTVYGIFLGDIEGKNISPAVGTITVREASADQTITTLGATKISKGFVAFLLTAKNIILNVHSGNVWKRTAGVVTVANGFKLNLAGGSIKEEKIASMLYLISDTSGATAQIEVQE